MDSRRRERRSGSEKFVRSPRRRPHHRRHTRLGHGRRRCRALQDQGVALTRDGGLFVGVQPGAAPDRERGITVRVVVARPDGARLAQLLDATASGHLPARVQAVIPLDLVAAAHRAVAKGGVRGKYVLRP